MSGWITKALGGGLHSPSAFLVIGAATGKILHIGVRNKYCTECVAAGKKGVAPVEHQCFKNWDRSSQAMEADAILEGFLQAETKHGLRYMRLIADGDSSVYAAIREHVPVWGSHVTKMECANHACKCLRSNLEKLVGDKPHYKGKGRLTERTRIRLTVAVRCAIRMRSKCENRAEGIQKLKHDILNSVHQVFGNHTNCSDFCKVRYPDVSETDTNATDTSIPSCSSTSATLGDEIGLILSENAAYWSQLTNEGDVRGGDTEAHDELTGQMLHDVAVLLNRVAAKADRLFGNFTTNLAECWMSIRSKFDGGKRVNRCLSGSWHARCFGAGLRRNVGVAWSPKVWTSTTMTEPGVHFTALYNTREVAAERTKIRQSQPEVEKMRYDRKHLPVKPSTTQEAVESYGPKAKEVVPEVEPVELDRLKTDFLRDNIYLPEAELSAIETNTIGQSSSPLWIAERRKRLTSSNFHAVVVRRPTIPVTPLVNQLLYSGFSGTSATRFGLREETSACQEYILSQRSKGLEVSVRQVGLKIDPDHPYLASSADGLVFENGVKAGLVEIKHVLYNKNLSFEDAAKTMGSTFCLKLVDGELILKQNHRFIMQCQGQCNIYKLPWVDLVIRALHPYQFHVVRVERNVQLWEQTMLPKLKAFYHKAMLPELAAPRHGKFPGIREPGLWFEPTGIKKTKSSVKCVPADPSTIASTASLSPHPREKKPSLSLTVSASLPLEQQKVSSRSTCSPNATPSAHHTPVDIAPSLISSSISLLPEVPTADPTAGPSTPLVNIPTDSVQSLPRLSASLVSLPEDVTHSDRPSRRMSRRVKFVGRRISHQWEDVSSDLLWYEGTVIDVLRGEDGDEDAMHEVLYEDDDESYEVDNLLRDLRDGSLVFIDLW